MIRTLDQTYEQSLIGRGATLSDGELKDSKAELNAKSR